MVIVRRIFQPKKFSSDICELLNNQSHCVWSLFTKHKSLKSDIFFNPTHIYSIFSRIRFFQGPSFFWVHVFQGPSRGSGSRFQRQPYMEITLRQMCYPINLLLISEHLFIRTPLKDCFCMFKLQFLCFCITLLILRIMWAFLFFH